MVYSRIFCVARKAFVMLTSFCHAENEASVCDRFCIAAFAQNTDPSCVGMTKRSWDDHLFVMLRNEASVCDRFLRRGICAADRSPASG